MPLVPMTQLLADARRSGYAVCYCEACNLESFQGVLEAAEETRSPIVAGFNGGFLMHPSRRHPEDLSYYAGMLPVLRAATVPVAFILNETDSMPQIEQAMALGFNAIMVEDEHLELEAYRRLVKQVVEQAHPRGIAVEAQLGRLRDASKAGDSEGQITDPREAQAFVAETDIDALGVSIGNMHIVTEGKAAVDLEALRKISAAVDIPLVVHGGTGFPPGSIADVIRLGVAKFNFGTGLKQAYLAAVQKKLAAYREPMNPHPFLGMGGDQDILVGGREAVKAIVKQLICLCGSAGKAPGK